MYKNKRILALIPARGGSKGIKNKNIREVGGKPLIAYSIASALESSCFEDVVISTDSADIAAIAEKYGAQVPFMRPAILAEDISKTEDAIVHAVETLAKNGKHYDILVLLQPTSPLRDSQDILDAVNLFIDRKISSLASVTPVIEHPLFMRTADETGRMKRILDLPSNVRRQDLDPYYIVNGAIYINHIKDITPSWAANDNEYAFVMSKEHSLDINEMSDLKMAERLLSETSFQKPSLTGSD